MNYRRYLQCLAIVVLSLAFTSCQWTMAKTKADSVNSTATATTLTTRLYPQFSRKQVECWNMSISQPTIGQDEVLRCAQDDLKVNVAQLALLVDELRENLKRKTSQLATSDPYPINLVEGFDGSQTEWERFVEKQCKWESSLWYGNSAAPMVNTSCRATRTYERILQLRPLLCSDFGKDGLCSEAQKYS